MQLHAATSRAIIGCGLLALSALLGCGHVNVVLDNRPCDAQQACASGYACDPHINTCVSLLDPKPPFIVDLRATAGDRSVTLTMSLPGMLFDECVLLRKQGGIPKAHDDPLAFKVSASLTGMGEVSVTDSGLQNGLLYAYLATCRLGAGWSDAAMATGEAINAVTASPLDPAPLNPSDVTVVPAAPGKLSVRFSMPLGAIDECVVRSALAAAPAGHSSGLAVGLPVTGGGQKQVIESGLVSGTTVFFAVYCRNGTTWNDSLGGGNFAASVVP